jgi:hypothetical protein
MILFPLDFPTKTLYASLFYLIRATCPTHLILVYFISRLIFVEQYVSWTSSLCSLLQFLVTWSLLDPDVFLSTLLLDTLSLCSSLSVTGQVSPSWKPKLSTASEAKLSVLFTVLVYGGAWRRGSTSLLTSKLKVLGLQPSPGTPVSDKVLDVFELRIHFQV